MNTSNSKVMYFGYGANRDRGMIEAIVGHKLNITGTLAVLNDYELCIQTWDEIEPRVKEILQRNWGPDFETYAIRKAEGKRVAGTLFLLSPQDRVHIDNWEMNDGLWYMKTPVQVFGKDNYPITAETEIIDDPSIKHVVDGDNYASYLNSPERMHEVARKVGETYRKEHHIELEPEITDPRRRR